MNTTKSFRILPVAAGVLALIAAAALPAAGRAEEPAPECNMCAAKETPSSLLGKIPYLGKLFKNVSHKEVEQIGVDFDFEIRQDGQACPQIVAIPVPHGSPTPFFAVRRTGLCLTAAECCEEEACCGKECAEASACCQAACEVRECGGRSWERIIELTAHNAALEATLEAQGELVQAQGEFQDARAEMMEHFAEVLVEKAKLEAKVESLAHQAEFTKEMLTLASENARLKAQIEMGEAKLAMIHEMAKLAIENEQLKLAARSRAVPAQLSNDLEHLPPAPTTRATHAAPAKKASFQESGSFERESEAKPSR